MNSEHVPCTVEEAFARQRLPTPPIPEHFIGDIRQREEWLWSTRPDVTAFGMYDRSSLIDYLTSPSRVADYWAASFAGHGTNSYSMNLTVVSGLVALFLQAEWGGVYTDDDQQRLLIGNQFIACSRLLAQSETLRKPRISPSTTRLVVVVSDFRGSALGWLAEPAADVLAAREWLTERAVVPSEAEARSVDEIDIFRTASEWLRNAWDGGV